MSLNTRTILVNLIVKVPVGKQDGKPTERERERVSDMRHAGRCDDVDDDDDDDDTDHNGRSQANGRRVLRLWPVVRARLLSQ